MLELAVIVLRLLQYATASILMGSALFFVYALPPDGAERASAQGWTKPLLTYSAFGLTVTTLLGLVAQTGVMAGGLAEGLRAESLSAVVSGMTLGKAAIARAVLGGVATALLLASGPGRLLWVTTAGLGALATATFAWMGHAAATEGDGRLLHLGADALHALAAAGWVGALVSFVFFLRPRTHSAEALHAIFRALQRFSAMGIALVTVLAATGLVNGWFLVGPDLSRAAGTGYGQLLVLKLVMFGAMVGLAALHRQRFVPSLGRRLHGVSSSAHDVLAALRRSIAIEAALGFGVLAVVAWLGTLPHPAG